MDRSFYVSRKADTKKYIMELTTEEGSQLNTIVKLDKMWPLKRLHAQVFLEVDEWPACPGMKNVYIAATFGYRTKTVEWAVAAIP